MEKVIEAFKNISNERKKFQECSPRKTNTPYIKDTFIPLLKNAVEALSNLAILRDYYVFYSKGASGFPDTPWIAIKHEDKTAQKGIYLLFRFLLLNDVPKIDISLNQGYTEYNDNKEKLKCRANDLRSTLNFENDCIPEESEKRDIFVSIWLEEYSDCEKLLNEYVNLYKNYCELKTLIYAKKTLETRYNIVLTGAPGTGKTYLAKDIAANQYAPREDMFVTFNSFCRKVKKGCKEDLVKTAPELQKDINRELTYSLIQCGLENWLRREDSTYCKPVSQMMVEDYENGLFVPKKNIRKSVYMKKDRMEAVEAMYRKDNPVQQWFFWETVEHIPSLGDFQQIAKYVKERYNLVIPQNVLEADPDYTFEVY